MLGAAGTATVGAGLTAGGFALAGTDGDPAPADADATIAFHGLHQAGIATAPQTNLQFASFDFRGKSTDDLRDLLRAWSKLAAELCAGRRPPVKAAGANPDTGERGRVTGSLTITFGLGPTLFEMAGEDRFGLRHQMPAALRPLPKLPGDELDSARSGGDLAIQICGNDRQSVFHALHNLTVAGHGAAVPKWLQSAFLPTAIGDETPRNLMGFRDGTNNLRGDKELAAHVWSDGSEQAWMRGGTYLVARRIRILLDVWDASSLEHQERAVGRHKLSGAPLGGRREHEKIDLTAPELAPDAHIRLASTDNGRPRLLRRSYNYSDGVDPSTGQLDAGLFFICFQRDPHAQFVPIQRRLGERDALRKFLSHTGSASFACPPGAPRGDYVGSTLLT